MMVTKEHTTTFMMLTSAMRMEWEGDVKGNHVAKTVYFCNLERGGKDA